MFGIFNKSVLNSFDNTKCAEIYFQTVETFSIVCTFCDLKSFEFNDFLLHFKNVHLHTASEVIGFKDDIEESQTDCKITIEPDDHVNKNRKNSSYTTKKTNKSYTKEGYNESSSASDLDIDGSEDYEYKPKVLKSQTKNGSLMNNYQHKCTECEKTYKHPKSLARHKKKFHYKEAPYKCSSCEREFSEKSALNKHVRTAHVEFPCEQCPKKFKSMRDFKYHKTAHAGVLNFVCDVEHCGKAFFHKYRLNAYKKFAHTLQRKYVCEICGFGLKSKQALDTHVRSHTGEKPFACKECERRFASTSQLAEHKAMHLSEKPHICNVCSAAFARPKALYHHKHLHLEVKKFVCKICGKAYAQAAGLCGHMRQHKVKQFL